MRAKLLKSVVEAVIYNWFNNIDVDLFGQWPENLADCDLVKRPEIAFQQLHFDAYYTTSQSARRTQSLSAFVIVYQKIMLRLSSWFLEAGVMHSVPGFDPYIMPQGNTATSVFLPAKPKSTTNILYFYQYYT
jgi:hypothetical protein